MVLSAVGDSDSSHTNPSLKKHRAQWDKTTRINGISVQRVKQQGMNKLSCDLVRVIGDLVEVTIQSCSKRQEGFVIGFKVTALKKKKKKVLIVCNTYHANARRHHQGLLRWLRAYMGTHCTFCSFFYIPKTTLKIKTVFKTRQCQYY